MNTLHYQSGNQHYIFRWTAGRTVELIDRIADMVHDPELNLTFLDAMLIADGVHRFGVAEACCDEMPPMAEEL